MPQSTLWNAWARLWRSRRVRSHSSSCPSEKILLVIFWTNPRNRSGFGSGKLRAQPQSNQRSSESLTPHLEASARGTCRSRPARPARPRRLVPGHFCKSRRSPVPWCVAMPSRISSSKPYFFAISKPSVTCLRMMSAEIELHLVVRVSRPWFSAKYSGWFIFPMSW